MLSCMCESKYILLLGCDYSFAVRRVVLVQVLQLDKILKKLNKIKVEFQNFYLFGNWDLSLENFKLLKS